VVNRLRSEHVVSYAARQDRATLPALRAALADPAWARRRAAVLHWEFYG
jgi:hypothetical protein